MGVDPGLTRGRAVFPLGVSWEFLTVVPRASLGLVRTYPPGRQTAAHCIRQAARLAAEDDLLASAAASIVAGQGGRGGSRGVAAPRSVPEHQQLSILGLVPAEHQDSQAEDPARQHADDLEQHPLSQPSPCPTATPKDDRSAGFRRPVGR